MIASICPDCITEMLIADLIKLSEEIGLQLFEDGIVEHVDFVVLVCL